jgi:hypothetical protein
MPENIQKTAPLEFDFLRAGAKAARTGDLELARGAIRERRFREKFFRKEIFADPAWDLLLELYLAHLEHRRVSVSSLHGSAGVPPTTGIRWIGRLTQEGYLERRDDPLDGRRVFVALTPDCERTCQSYFGCVAQGRPVQ